MLAVKITAFLESDMQKKLTREEAPKINKKGAYITIKKPIKYSEDGFTVKILDKGEYEASELPSVILDLHRRGLI
jgi:hypothetical protein